MPVRRRHLQAMRANQGCGRCPRSTTPPSTPSSTPSNPSVGCACIQLAWIPRPRASLEREGEGGRESLQREGEGGREGGREEEFSSAPNLHRPKRREGGREGGRERERPPCHGPLPSARRTRARRPRSRKRSERLFSRFHRNGWIFIFYLFLFLYRIGKWVEIRRGSTAFGSACTRSAGPRDSADPSRWER